LEARSNRRAEASGVVGDSMDASVRMRTVTEGVPWRFCGMPPSAPDSHVQKELALLRSLGGLRRLASLKMLTARSLRQGAAPIVMAAVIGPMSRGGATLSEEGSHSTQLSAASVGVETSLSRASLDLPGQNLQGDERVIAQRHALFSND